MFTIIYSFITPISRYHCFSLLLYNFIYLPRILASNWKEKNKYHLVCYQFKIYIFVHNDQFLSTILIEIHLIYTGFYFSCERHSPSFPLFRCLILFDVVRCVNGHSEGGVSTAERGTSGSTEGGLLLVSSRSRGGHRWVVAGHLQ